ncbi:hypothetical protein ACFYPZ_35670 [Streptomyces sp. NPDC005506]|uniref:hypothetical protein n=1 Tax=unclassified Streptomyces TaxID=2593676 RepID=UPI00368F8AF7
MNSPRPPALIHSIDLLPPVCAQTAAHGHRAPHLPPLTQERIDRVQALREASGAK